MKMQAFMQFTAPCLFFLFLSLLVQAQKLKPFNDARGKYGYKNESGVVVVPAKYQSADYFLTDNVAVIKFNNKWGVIDSTGKEVVPPKYDSIGKGYKGFLGKYLAVKLNGKWGLINKAGKEVVAVKYQDVEDFEDEGLFRVKLNNKWGCVNSAGKEIIPLKYDRVVSYFKKDIALAQLNKKWGAINSKDKVIIPLKYDYLEYMFQFQHFTGWLLANLNGKIGCLYAEDGFVTIPFLYHDVKEYKINYNDNAWDTTELQPIGQFNGGLIMVALNGKWGAIDANGRETIPFKYEDIINEPRYDAIRDGLYWYKVRLNNKWGMVDSAGNELIALRYPTALFRYDFEAVKKLAALKKKNVPANYNVVKNQTRANEVQNNTATNNTNSQGTKEAVVKMKGKIDPSIAGTWKHYNAAMDMSNYYVFREDGTFDYYPGYIGANNSMASRNCNWRIDGEFLETSCDGYKNAERYAFRKQNDPATGKAALMIEFKGAVSAQRLYVAEGNKQAWK